MKINLAPVAIFLAAVAAVTSAHAAEGQQAGTTVVLELETGRPEGRIAVALYRDADSFRQNKNPVRVLTLDRSGPTTRAQVNGLAPGRYAIAAFQDLDSDGQLDKGALGIPSEPFGFSSGARARFGPPSFEAAAFAVGVSGATQRIILRSPMNAILR